MNRRELLFGLSSTTATLAALTNPHFVLGQSHRVQRELFSWARRTEEITALLRGEILTVDDWRSGLDRLFASVDMGQILEDIDFDQVSRDTGFADMGVAFANIDVGAAKPKQLSFVPRMFAVGQGRAIIPHGHANMVSAHITLSGEFRLRQYDQLDRNDEGLLIRPSIDGLVRPGDVSSIGLEGDNVHWFVAEKPSHTLDIIVVGLDDDAPKTFDIFNIDIERARLEPNGDLFAPHMEVEEALAKYG